MSDDMNEKYQQYYNQLLTGTLTETMLKGITFQANIKLANDIIAEQDKNIQASQETIDSLKKELEDAKNTKSSSDNSKILELEGQIKGYTTTIARLQSDLFEMNKSKTEYENVKHQVQHLDTYRNEVIKANETIKSIQNDHLKVVNGYELKIKDLSETIESLKTPAKKKKVSKTVVTEEPVIPETKPKAKIIKQELPGLIVKDGGSF